MPTDVNSPVIIFPSAFTSLRRDVPQLIPKLMCSIRLMEEGKGTCRWFSRGQALHFQRVRGPALLSNLNCIIVRWIQFYCCSYSAPSLLPSS